MPDQDDTRAPQEKPDAARAGDARPDRAPGESGRGDLSDTDRVGSHEQGRGTPDEARPVRPEDLPEE